MPAFSCPMAIFVGRMPVSVPQGSVRPVSFLKVP